MYIDESELIEVKIFYKKLSRFNYVAYSKNEFDIIMKAQDETRSEAPNTPILFKKDDFKSIEVKLRPMGWGLYNELQDLAMKEGANGEREWSYKKYKENKLLKTIVDWDVKKVKKTPDGETEEKTKITMKLIQSIAPEICEAIINAYDNLTLMDDDEEKK